MAGIYRQWCCLHSLPGLPIGFKLFTYSIWDFSLSQLKIKYICLFKCPILKYNRHALSIPLMSLQKTLAEMYIKVHSSICKSLGQACTYLVHQRKIFPHTHHTFYCAPMCRMVFNMYHHRINIRRRVYYACVQSQTGGIDGENQKTCCSCILFQQFSCLIDSHNSVEGAFHFKYFHDLFTHNG